ncbi:MAG: AAA family ATPase [Gallionella sp.]|nr:AAA family ATPase [Gallionella sp.]MDD4947524.1 AAA family ATPase [Gallionella sp.]MDD5611951.1 AAA family ATPase [Gallionella sp.]
MSSLYLDYFDLKSPPFSITPDPGFFFEGGDRGAFIAGLTYAAQQAEGIILVVGEVGSGKTMMSRLLLNRFQSHVDTVYLPNPSFSRDEIIDIIARDLGIPTNQQGVRLEALQQELIKRHAEGRQVVVLIDEAHAMPAESIEEVRRLSNLETDDCKLVQLILCGQPELDTLLAAPHLRQVRDRVVYRLVLNNLSRRDASAYLDHRLRVAGWRGGRIFTWLGEQLLITDARGRARRLNLLADKALLAAFAEGKRQVDVRHVLIAIKESGANFSSVTLEKQGIWQQTALLMALAAVATIAIWLTSILN